MTAVGLRARSFAEIKDFVKRRSSRVIIMHLTIIFGMFGMLLTHSALTVLYVLIALKTGWELVGVAGASGARAKRSGATGTGPAQRAALEDEEVVPR